MWKGMVAKSIIYQKVLPRMITLLSSKKTSIAIPYILIWNDMNMQES